MAIQFILSFKDCPHCGSRVTLRRHPDCQPEDWPKLEKLVCCNRCADHQRDRSKVTDAIFKTCSTIYCAQFTKTASRADSEIARESLAVLTKRLATIECNFYGVQNFWEESFASLLFDRPDKSGNILADYTKRIKAIGREEVKEAVETELVEA